jgi:hypothetical protein
MKVVSKDYDTSLCCDPMQRHDLKKAAVALSKTTNHAMTPQESAEIRLTLAFIIDSST